MTHELFKPLGIPEKEAFKSMRVAKLNRSISKIKAKPAVDPEKMKQDNQAAQELNWN